MKKYLLLLALGGCECGAVQTNDNYGYSAPQPKEREPLEIPPKLLPGGGRGIPQGPGPFGGW